MRILYRYSPTSSNLCFGYLYNFYVVNDSREISSSIDWNVPSVAQWDAMRLYVGSANYGKVLSTSLNYWQTPGTNEYGMSFVGSGNRGSNGTFIQLKDSSTIHTNLNYDATHTFTGTVNDNPNIFVAGIYFKKTGSAIRLVKDATGVPDGTPTTYTGNDGKVYNAIAFNQLYWLTENLEETQYRNGDYIAYVSDNTIWSNLTTGALSIYNNDTSNACKVPIATPIPYTDTTFGGQFNPVPDDCSGITFPIYPIAVSKSSLVTRYFSGTDITSDDIVDIEITRVIKDADVNATYNGSDIQVGDVISFTGTYPNGYIFYGRTAYGTDNQSIDLYFTVKVNGYIVRSDEFRYGYTFTGCTQVFETINYGYLYNQFTLTDVRNIANTGWHAPTMNEMAVLAANLPSTTVTVDSWGPGINQFTNYVSSEVDTWRNDTIGWFTLGTNTSGLSMRGSSYRQTDGTYSGLLQISAYFWSATKEVYDWGYYLVVQQSGDFETLGGMLPSTEGMAIFLIKDSTTLIDGETGTYTGNDGKLYQTICYDGVEYVLHIKETQYRNGDPIPEVNDSVTWSGLTSGARTSYNNDESYA